MKIWSAYSGVAIRLVLRTGRLVPKPFLTTLVLPSANLRKKICWRSMAVQKGTQSSLRPEVLKFNLGGIVDEFFLCYEQRG